MEKPIKNIFLLVLLLLLASGITLRCKRFEMDRQVILTTNGVEAVERTSCVVHGSLLDLKDQNFSSYGVHWTTSLDDIRARDTVNLGQVGEVKDFSVRILNLEAGTKYYAWTFVHDGSKEYRASPIEFTTAEPGIPIVETGKITVTGPNSAGYTANIPDDGAAPVSQRGLCYGLDQMPGLDGLHTGDGSGAGDFGGQMEGLTPATLYYARAYAINSAGTGFGDVHTFTTPTDASPPAIEISDIRDLGFSSVTISANITSDGGGEITEKGFCWNVNPLPTVDNHAVVVGSGTAPFEHTITGLEPEVHYYVRAFASNAAGTKYSLGVEFDTRLAPLEDTRDGKVYATVRIGDQVWMAQNLNVGEMINGSLECADNGSIEKYCYQNTSSYCEEYGALYSWEEMMQYNLVEGAQGVCPDGWHIPSDADWKQLEMYLGMTKEQADAENWRGVEEGGALKATGFEYWDAPNNAATNSSGFNALPAGGMDNTGYFASLGFFAHYWTSSWLEPNPWYRLISADEGRIMRTLGNKDYATGVRCVRDE